MMTRSEEFRENARNCGALAEQAEDLPSKNRFKRMQDAWLALAEEQDWLDGKKSPTHKQKAPLDPGLL